MKDRRVLLISDQFAPSEHSAVEGIFGAGLPGMAETAIVEFSRALGAPQVRDLRLVLPAACRRRGLVAAIQAVWPRRRWDFVIVRNKFPTLTQVLAARPRLQAQIGFWLSFPHSYRRLHEAIEQRRAVWRKRLEYWLRDWRERRWLRRCDFFIPITARLVEEFYPELAVPWHPLPMGIDVATLGAHARTARSPSPLRMVYTGTVDALRRLDIIVDGLRRLPRPFVLEIYTASENPAVEALRALNDARFRLLPARPRAELFSVIESADVGIGLIPDNRLYRVGSPTKTLEYAALGLLPLVNHHPDYAELFDEASAEFCAFEAHAIAEAARRLSALPVTELAARGARARAMVCERRDYRRLAAGLAGFLDQLAVR
jgi:glycosyltransferase involved in cell wall biosynthesis